METTSNLKPRSLVPLASLTMWGVSSSAMIIINKHIMVDMGFKYPLLLTGCNQAASALAGLTAWKLGFLPLRTLTPGFFGNRLLPIAACAAGTLYFGNVAYLSLSLTFIQILKVLTPAATLALCIALQLERPSLQLVSSIALICLGTAVATVLESSAAGFSWTGFWCFSLSVLTEAVRVVCIQMLLGSFRFNQAEVLVYMGCPTAVMLLLGSAVCEQAGLMHAFSNLHLRLPGMFLASMIMGALVNWATTFAIQNTSSLTFKVFGCLKNVFVVLYGIVMGDEVSAAQLMGYGVSVAGFVWYTHSKQREAVSSAKKAA